ncbi:hypothetical protein [Cohnella caldifontis]|uniref:hypothetical protein n=1 Tax=Cohnella caldifontis TaxID=3027471 RepID=UPI0023EC10DD|nr:hypothetical protein [Cohnella sp. YIM B05605]
MSMDRFEQEHRKWLDSHLARRKGERKRRLEAGHAHAEKEMQRKIWIPVFGNLEYLHPEYEVRDFLEFCDERIRHMHLVNDGWIVIRIGYDDIVERPRPWRQLLRYAGVFSADPALTIVFGLALSMPVSLLVTGALRNGWKRDTNDAMPNAAILRPRGSRHFPMAPLAPNGFPSSHRACF